MSSAQNDTMSDSVGTGILVQICLYILTWNVDGHYPSVSLNDALSINSTDCPNGSHLPDIYVISFQNTQYEERTNQHSRWESKLADLLDQMGYRTICSDRMRGLLITAWAQHEHMNNLKDIETRHVRTDTGWGNKGSVSVRFNLYGVGVVFVACDFTASDENFLDRVDEFEGSIYNQRYKTRNYRDVFDHNFVFCFGDLNFRLDGEQSTIIIKSTVSKGNLKELYKSDQLKWTRGMPIKLALMREQEPDFPPTCKFVEGTTEYDLMQRPAWCDRILYYFHTKRSSKQLDLTQIAYKSHGDYILSTHKPVSAEFLLTIPLRAPSEDDITELTNEPQVLCYREHRLNECGKIRMSSAQNDTMSDSVGTGILVQICLYILTWNVDGHYPSVSLNDALSINSTDCPNGSHLPDIYVISFQNTQYEERTNQHSRWESKLADLLDQMGYRTICSDRMRGLLITAWAQHEHMNNLKDIETRHVRTDTGWGNKGSVSVRFNLYGVGVVFVACDFTASDENFLDRVDEFEGSIYNQRYKTRNYRDVFDHNFVFCFGDLNFRLDGEQSTIIIKSTVSKGNLKELYKSDQLKWTRGMPIKLALMREQEPDFPPTCKFVEGTTEYDLMQRPAWCDRILYYFHTKRSSKQLDLTQIAYKSHGDYILSTHKPVSAEFLLTIPLRAPSEDDITELTNEPQFQYWDLLLFWQQSQLNSDKTSVGGILTPRRDRFDELLLTPLGLRVTNSSIMLNNV
uniref:Inositol polyphosphate-related phosphatase domain-containing protein n=1 Tax=Glossina austeni TaxID=7395 RepID=A0A1A9V3D1_GLOAU